MNRPAKLQRLYQILSSRKLDTTKKRGVTLRYTMFEGGFIFARNTAGESPASFRTDWTVRFARPSAVRKRRPYPLSGCPASLLKIVIGKSTFASVSGTAYFCQPTGWAAATVGTAKMDITTTIVRISKFRSEPLHHFNERKNTMFRSAAATLEYGGERMHPSERGKGKNWAQWKKGTYTPKPRSPLRLPILNRTMWEQRG